MRATVMYGAGDVRVEQRPDATALTCRGRVEPGGAFDPTVTLGLRVDATAPRPWPIGRREFLHHR